MRREQIVNRAWRAYADVRRFVSRTGSARPVLRTFDAPDRGDLATWNAATSAAFDRYRTAYPPVSGRIDVVCVSQRPHAIDDVVANVLRQDPAIAVGLVFVTNHADFGEIDLDARFAALPSWTVVEMPPQASLGACLNAGLAVTGERFVAKFDDDDWYGPGYVADSLRAHGYAGAAVIGKHSYYADLTGTGVRYLRFPGHEFAMSSTLAGGTLVIDRERAAGVEFEDVSLGEDRRFIAACHRRGLATFAADRFNFVQRRGADNTWAIDDDLFLRGCQPVDPDDPVHAVER